MAIAAGDDRAETEQKTPFDDLGLDYAGPLADEQSRPAQIAKLMDAIAERVGVAGVACLVAAIMVDQGRGRDAAVYLTEIIEARREAREQERENARHRGRA